MPLPSFTVTGDLFNILGVDASELASPTLNGTITFTPNVPTDSFVTWEGHLYRVAPIPARITGSGITYNGQPVLLLANDAGLSVTGLQWHVEIVVKPDPGSGTTATMKDFWFTAPADGATIDLAAVTPAPNVGAQGVTFDEDQLVALLSDGTSNVRETLDALYTGSGAWQPLDADLTALAALTPSNDDVVQRKAGAWTNRTPTQLKTDLAVQSDDITDFNVATASPGDSLVFDGNDWVSTEALPVNLTSPTNGQVLSYSSGQWINQALPAAAGSSTFAVKPSDTSKTSDTTMAKDGGFDLAVASGEQWLLEYFILIASGSQTPDIKAAIVVPAASTGWWGVDGLIESATSSAANVRRLASTSFGTGNAMAIATNTTALFARIAGLVTAGTTGTVELWWAQNTSDATASTIKAGSLLRATKIS